MRVLLTPLTGFAFGVAVDEPRVVPGERTKTGVPISIFLPPSPSEIACPKPVLMHACVTACNLMCKAWRCASGMALTMVHSAGQVDMDAESANYDSLLHREHFGHGHEARVAAGKKVCCPLK